MTRLAVGVSIGLAVFVLVVSCGPGPMPGCAQSLCGCWEDATLNFSTRVAETDGGAIAGADVQCIGGTVDPQSKPPTVTTDASGNASFSFATQNSPGCGWLNCNNVRVTRSDGGFKEFPTASVNGKTATMP